MISSRFDTCVRGIIADMAGHCLARLAELMWWSEWTRNTFEGKRTGDTCSATSDAIDDVEMPECWWICNRLYMIYGRVTKSDRLPCLGLDDAKKER